MKSIIGIAYAFAITTAAFPLTPDYFPAAVGNWWTYESKAGSMTISITAVKGDTFMASGADDFVLNDSTGYAMSPASLQYIGDQLNWQFRMIYGKSNFYSCDTTCTRMSQFAVWPTVTTKAGTFHNVILFSISDHAYIGKHRMAAPGVGIIRDQAMGNDTTSGYTLTGYHLEPLPEGLAHTVNSRDTAGVASSLFSFSRTSAAEGTVLFRIKADACALNDAVVSYHQGRRCMRVYIADTSASACAGARLFDHSIALRNLDFSQDWSIKVYFRETRRDRTNRLLYTRTISASTSAARQPFLTPSRGSALTIAPAIAIHGWDAGAGQRQGGSMNCRGQLLCPIRVSSGHRAAIMTIITGESR